MLGLETSTQSTREELFSAWRTFFERIAAAGPVVLVFEDLESADPGLLDFIDHLLDWSRGVPLFIVTLAETGRLPVDNPTTHLELTMIHEAMILEYSGRYLALIEWAAWLKLFIFFSLLANLFLHYAFTERLGAAHQPGGARLDALLWPVLSVGMCAGSPPSQRGPGSMGATEVHAAAPPRVGVDALVGTHRTAGSGPVCPLAAWCTATGWRVRAG